MIKINNIKEPDNKYNYKVKRKSKVGMIISILTIGAIASGCFGNSNNDNNNNSISKVYDICDVSNVSMADVNELNIILNDDDCSDMFFEDICQILRDDGVEFTVTKNSSNINNDNSTIISLDQQYSSGASTLIFAPKSNTRLGNSDSLAIAMKSAFDQNEFFVDNIMCCQTGFEENDKGEVSCNVPTKTEKAIDEDKETSFVTISFGTQNINAEWVAKSIENGLARQRYYLDNYDNTDLIYCTNANDSIDDIAKYFGVNQVSLKDYNNIKDNTISDSSAIVNPDVENLGVFNKKSIFKIDDIKTRAY